MHVPKIDARYVHMEGAKVELGTYADGSLALVASDTDEDGILNQETFSVNLAPAYGLVPPEGHVYVKNYSEHEGLPEALEALGIVKIVEWVKFGPYNMPAALVEVTLS